MLFGGKMFVIVTYDIKMDDNGARVLNNVFKICKKYLFRVQHSVFAGELTKIMLDELKEKLLLHLRMKIDNCKIYSIKNYKNVIIDSVTDTDKCKKNNIIY